MGFIWRLVYKVYVICLGNIYVCLYMGLLMEVRLYRLC